VSVAEFSTSAWMQSIPSSIYRLASATTSSHHFTRPDSF
jgi:hypothetical protein